MKYNAGKEVSFSGSVRHVLVFCSICLPFLAVNQGPAGFSSGTFGSKNATVS